VEQRVATSLSAFHCHKHTSNRGTESKGKQNTHTYVITHLADVASSTSNKKGTRTTTKQKQKGTTKETNNKNKHSEGELLKEKKGKLLRGRYHERECSKDLTRGRWRCVLTCNSGVHKSPGREGEREEKECPGKRESNRCRTTKLFTAAHVAVKGTFQNASTAPHRNTATEVGRGGGVSKRKKKHAAPSYA
jgi:hypothetical protein